MTRRLIAAVVVVMFGLIFTRLAAGYIELGAMRPLAEYYVTQGPSELGVANIVTGILIAYRGFDTLGEVAVLFMVAASVGLLLKQDGAPVKAAAAELVAAKPASAGAPQPKSSPPQKPTANDDATRRDASEIVQTGTGVLLPLIFIFGAYVIVNGHLSAGGGFQGGAIVASGVMLMLLARPASTLNVAMLSIIESFAGVFYVLIGILGLILAGGFLDPRFLPKGEFGTFISAGAIPLISALLGIKVGAELSVIIDRFRS